MLEVGNHPYEDLLPGITTLGDDLDTPITSGEV